MTITLSYSIKGGRMNGEEVESNATTVLLSKRGIADIDLSPLAGLPDLTELWLDNNQLQSIDLTPLRDCSGLKVLNLSFNELVEVNLSPLEGCPELTMLNLEANRLKDINLTPLVSCNDLRGLFLRYNLLERMDLTPLYRQVSKGVNSGVLQYSSDGNVQETSWLRTRGTGRQAAYARPLEDYTWPFLHRVLELHGDDIRVQQDILKAIGLGEYGFIDEDLRDIMLSNPQESTLESVRASLLPSILELIEESTSSTGLNLDHVVRTEGELGLEVDRILQAREQEIGRVRIGAKFGVMDLTELYLTAYGYQILSGLGLSLKADLTLLPRIQKPFNELGLEVKIYDSPVSGVQMSDELKQAILWIVKNNGRPWSEIEIEPVRRPRRY